MSLPKRLLKLRKGQGLTQQAMAEAIGIHVNSLKKYEAGQAQPSLEALKKIAVAMNVSTDYLLFEEHERGPSEDLVLQFEAISQFDEEDKELAHGLLEGLILKHQAKQSMLRQRK
ncbi:MAG: XRE family transcriptional regulator [Gammaproteobacteria bacterium]|nr:MAG: XRE family transcriptional regulator [Gammaproteobacteria bacterium]